MDPPWSLPESAMDPKIRRKSAKDLSQVRGRTVDFLVMKIRDHIFLAYQKDITDVNYKVFGLVANIGHCCTSILLNNFLCT